MYKRTMEYRLVRCAGGARTEKRQMRKRVRRKAGKMLFQGVFVCLLSFASVWLSLKILVPDFRAHVLAAGSILPENAADSETAARANELIAAQLEREFAPADSAEEKTGFVRDRDYAQLDRADILVAIDPGHGGVDEGCSRANIHEKDINLSIAKLVESRLANLGYRVMLSRNSDTEVTLEERADKANEAGADIFVSIHQNACEQNSADISGVETWYNEGKGDSGSRRLARLIHSDVLLYSGARDRGEVADESLYVIRETDMPACLVETGFLSDRTERDKLVTEEYQDRLAEAIVSGIDLYFFPKTMYLTFDDGPTRENTDAVLDILKAHDVKATFFLIGESVEKYPEVAKRIAAEGHTIGIHCNNHSYKNLYASVDSYIEDFEKARETVYETTGVEVKLFRFPGGSINNHNKKIYSEIIEEMTERGYIYFDWNASLDDASKNNESSRLLRNAKDSTLGRRRIVMLAHDTVDNTVQCLEELIEQFPEYRMLPLTEDVEPIQF